jgi:N-acetyl-gamma-glutamyl-phosphate reductase
MKDSLNIAIAGATGFVGIELIKILLKHKKVKILNLCATKSVGKNIHTFDKKLKNKKLPKISQIQDLNWEKINIIFTALPDGEAQKIAKIIPAAVKLIDLSGDFRLRKSNDYKKWYGLNHNCKKLINKSYYSIPEFSKKEIKNYNIISCPGCYPTSVQLPLVPLIQKKMINVKNIIIDSKSGYSGAGRGVKKKFKSDIFNSVSAYGVGCHKHMIEIDQELSKRSKLKVNVSFTPHLMPMFRGILSTIYIQTRGKIDAIKVYKFLKKYHKNNFFIKFAKFNTPIGTDSVINTNFCKISVCKNREKNKIIIISAIDNLIKGASGQAVQNMNIAFNFRESMGLI